MENRGARPLSQGELWRVLAAARTRGPRTLALVGLLAYTGGRISEVLALRWRDLRSMREQRWLPHVAYRRQNVKGKERTRYVPSPPELQTALYPWWAESPLTNQGEQLVFPGRRGRAWSRSAATRELEQLLREELGDEGRLSSHSFRKAYADRLLAGGLTLPAVSVLLGHSDVSTTMHYLARPSEAQLELAARAAGQVQP